eukprot:362555-Chlamydomonas_euryale.AAC.8
MRGSHVVITPPTRPHVLPSPGRRHVPSDAMLLAELRHNGRQRGASPRPGAWVLSPPPSSSPVSLRFTLPPSSSPASLCLSSPLPSY